MKGTIIAALIGAAATITAAFIGVNYGKSVITNQNQSQINNVIGNDNTVNINSVEELASSYINLQDENFLLQNENETLKAKNTAYFEEISEKKNELASLSTQIEDFPAINFTNLALCINGNDIPIDANKSMITVDGKDYLSKEMAEKFLLEDNNISIKGNTLFVGKIIYEKANLFDQWILDSSDIDFVTNATDSFGNVYSNLIRFNAWRGGGKIIYNLNNKYNNLKCILSVSSGSGNSYTGIVTITADDTVVYTSPEIKKTTPPISIDVPINNCSLLTLQYSGNSEVNCIISDAEVYN